MKTVFHTNESNVLQHEFPIQPQVSGEYSLPYGAVDVRPVEPGAGFALVWTTALVRTDPDFGKDRTGAWERKADYRTIQLFRVDTGDSYVINTDVNGMSFDGLGERPPWLTDIARPGHFYTWSNGEWLLDTDAQADAAKTAERAWRDSEIARTDYLMMDDYPISEAGRAELSVYRMALRDWPANPLFPESSARPVAPVWIERVTK